MSHALNTAQTQLYMPASNAPSLMSRIAAGFAVSHQRKQLKALDDAALADIGLSRQDVEQEVNRSFWDVPSL